MNRIRIMEEQWDYLIILDACRYDYFESVWKKYFKGDGDLTKVISVGSSTREWRDESFQNYYGDVCYISANPYINSIVPVKGFSGSRHFHKVYDLWKEGWDEKRGTVLPETVTNMAADIINRNRDKRTIIHYLQPHQPYLDPAVNMPGFLLPDFESGRIVEWSHRSKITERVAGIFTLVLNKIEIFGNRPCWTVREFLHVRPVNAMEMTRRIYGKAGLRETYKRNLEIVVVEVLRLLNDLSGKIVITSDHGELLGEGRCYGHWKGSSNPYLIEIPWLILRKQSDSMPTLNPKRRKEKGEMKDMEQEAFVGEKTDEKNQGKIMKKLRDLGYLD
jgi:hypothetical protein